MIIDDLHQVAFVHIPKCGGTSVWRQFGVLDSSGGAFKGKTDHPQLGLILRGHIPLRFLRQCFPDEFNRLLKYNTFALVRDPYDRFASATFQRLEEFLGVLPLEVTSERALMEARKVTDWLKNRSEFCDMEYIHFARQVDYLSVDGEQVVSNVYPLERMAEFGTAFGAATGMEFKASERENVNSASLGGLARVLRPAKPIYRRLTSWRFREGVLSALNRVKPRTANRLYEKFRRDPDLRSFVESYYADDFAARRSANARHVAKAESHG